MCDTRSTEINSVTYSEKLREKSPVHKAHVPAMSGTSDPFHTLLQPRHQDAAVEESDGEKISMA